MSFWPRIVAPDVPGEKPWDHNPRVKAWLGGKRILSVETRPGVMSHATFERARGQWWCVKAYERLPFGVDVSSEAAMAVVRAMDNRGSSFWT